LYASAGAGVSAIDLTDKVFELTKSRLKIQGLSSEVQKPDAENLPFDDQSFDVVVSFGVLHHTPDTEKALAEIFRVLKADGRIMLMLYHRNSFAYQLLFRIKSLIQPGWRGKSSDDQVNAVDGAENPLGKVYAKKTSFENARPISLDFRNRSRLGVALRAIRIRLITYIACRFYPPSSSK
jgi:ubiquinone/menaquinone biosynthesis C-methylase UbiE